MHIRRTDYPKYERKQHKSKPLNSEYYNDAMEYFREEYANCLFVVASDDIKWAKKYIDDSRNDVFFSDTNPKFRKIEDEDGVMYTMMDLDMSKALFDLTLLTNCNHTIISRGTFSMWIALLTPGEYYTEYGAIMPAQDHETSRLIK